MTQPTLSFPDTDTCWQAVQKRDRAFNGRFWFSVKSTGVYCLPSCAARPPLRRNVDFHASPQAAERAGFRACKRCKPLDWQADKGLSKPVADACALFDAADIDTQPSLAAVAARVGLSSGALGKRFVAELGMSPRDWLAARKRERFRKPCATANRCPMHSMARAMARPAVSMRAATRHSG
jgi:AraC family transcriptional regulator of adaptative response/methylated-DNA-[protein]-cysteine methyltransferase